MFFDIAKACAKRSTCLRRRVGAVVVDTEGTVVSTGYNGAPVGEKDCLQIEYCWRIANNIPSGSNYERCFSVHAEQNALIQAGKAARHGTLYIHAEQSCSGDVEVLLPCLMCAKLIVNAKIDTVMIREENGYSSYVPDEILRMRLAEAQMGD